MKYGTVWRALLFPPPSSELTLSLVDNFFGRLNLSLKKFIHKLGGLVHWWDLRAAGCRVTSKPVCRDTIGLPAPDIFPGFTKSGQKITLIPRRMASIYNNIEQPALRLSTSRLFSSFHGLHSPLHCWLCRERERKRRDIEILLDPRRSNHTAQTGKLVPLLI